MHFLRRTLSSAAVLLLRSADATARAFPVLAVILFVGVLVLGMIGHGQIHANENPSDPSVVLANLYRTLRLFTLEGATDANVPWAYQAARFLAALALFTGTFTALFALLPRRVGGLVARFGLYDHTVICGAGGKGGHLLKDLLERGAKVVVVEKDPANPVLDWCQPHGVPVIRGDARNRDVLVAAGVRSARSLVCVTHDDGTNVEIALAAKEILATRSLGAHPKPLEVHAYVAGRGVADQLGRHNLIRSGRREALLRAFDLNDVAARQLLRRHPFDVHARVLEADRPHAVIFGFGKMGENVLLNAAGSPYLKDLDAEPRNPAFTVIDRRMNALKESFLERYPQVSRTADLNFLQIEMTEGTYRSEAFQAKLAEMGRVTAYVVCMGEDEAALEAAIALRAAVWPRSGLAAPIFAQMYEDTGVARLAGSEGDLAALPNGIHAFGTLRSLCREETLIDRFHEELAHAIHEGYRASVRDAGRPLGGYDWAILPEFAKRSNRMQAEHIEAKLRLAGFALSARTRKAQRNPLDRGTPANERLARLEHARWNAEKHLDGWAYDPERDDARKRHDCLTDWERLTEKVRGYDHDAVANIPNLLLAAGRSLLPVRRLGLPPLSGKTPTKRQARAFRDDLAAHGDASLVLVTTLTTPWETALSRIAVEHHGAELEVLLPFPHEYVAELVRHEPAAWSDFAELAGRTARILEIPRPDGHYPPWKAGSETTRDYEASRRTAGAAAVRKRGHGVVEVCGEELVVSPGGARPA